MTTSPTANKTKSARIVLAPFGRHTWYMLNSYIRNVLTVTSILLAIGLTIDLWPQFQQIAATGSDAFSATLAIARFALLRTPGIISPLVPFATFIGVLWAEVAHTQSGERMLIWNSGRSPIQCLAPALFLGLLLGATDFTMDAALGPASMGIQMRERLGRDGETLDRNTLSKPAWIALPEGLLKAQIQYGPPPVLHDVALFRRDLEGRILEVYTAPVAQYENGRWHLLNGQFWQAGSNGGPRFGISGRQVMQPFDERVVALNLDPLWLSWYNLVPQYIPLPVLAKLAASDAVPDAHGQYETRLYVVLAGALLPMGMALLAASLAMLFLAYGTSAPQLIGIVFGGYMAHFAIKACLIMGQNGFIPPLFAGFTVPVILFTATGIVLYVCERQRKRITAG
ncbi:lipopolysaccharide export system permease protein [Rhizomicrobium palustre]|uniref:Lipopolysaccharide export system permease protein n=1 Tax=Rhizomicrobium palustre TaxID=189966 RepID=A0A846MVY6_9PROT|nr:LptF/LptG family permease [Rhizomicrobium palustre]NIK87385.1 lipopolysaccharide export system permease protein [Rhizomicrobium palustre]